MHCHLERIRVEADIGRIYQPGLSFKNRDPYTSSFVLLHQLGQIGEIAAVDKRLTRDEMWAIWNCLCKKTELEFLKQDRYGRTLLKRLKR